MSETGNIPKDWKKLKLGDCEMNQFEDYRKWIKAIKTSKNQIIKLGLNSLCFGFPSTVIIRKDILISEEKEINLLSFQKTIRVYMDLCSPIHKQSSKMYSINLLKLNIRIEQA